MSHVSSVTCSDLRSQCTVTCTRATPLAVMHCYVHLPEGRTEGRCTVTCTPSVRGVSGVGGVMLGYVHLPTYVQRCGRWPPALQARQRHRAWAIVVGLWKTCSGKVHLLRQGGWDDGL